MDIKRTLILIRIEWIVLSSRLTKHLMAHLSLFYRCGENFIKEWKAFYNFTIILFTILDINECLGNPCDVNAKCDNSPGSFSCTCNTGYSGNGFACKGKCTFQKRRTILWQRNCIQVFQSKLCQTIVRCTIRPQRV